MVTVLRIIGFCPGLKLGVCQLESSAMRSAQTQLASSASESIFKPALRRQPPHPVTHLRHLGQPRITPRMSAGSGPSFFRLPVAARALAAIATGAPPAGLPTPDAVPAAGCSSPGKSTALTGGTITACLPRNRRFGGAGGSESRRGSG